MGSVGCDPFLTRDLFLRYPLCFTRSMHFSLQVSFVFDLCSSAPLPVPSVSVGFVGCVAPVVLIRFAYSHGCVSRSVPLSLLTLFIFSLRLCAHLFVSPTFLPMTVAPPTQPATNVKCTVATQNTTIATVSDPAQLLHRCTNASSPLSAFLALPAARHVQCLSPFTLRSSSLSVLGPISPSSPPRVLCLPGRFHRSPPTLNAQVLSNKTQSPPSQAQTSFSSVAQIPTCH